MRFTYVGPRRQFEFSTDRTPAEFEVVSNAGGEFEPAPDECGCGGCAQEGEDTLKIGFRA